MSRTPVKALQLAGDWDRLRSRFPQARSMLMDRGTLLAHRSQWMTEATPTKAALGLLDIAEQGLYQDLINGTFGRAVRLEQERVGFGSLEQALARIGVSTMGCHAGEPDEP